MNTVISTKEFKIQNSKFLKTFPDGPEFVLELLKAAVGGFENQLITGIADDDNPVLPAVCFTLVVEGPGTYSGGIGTEFAVFPAG